MESKKHTLFLEIKKQTLVTCVNFFEYCVSWIAAAGAVAMYLSIIINKFSKISHRKTSTIQPYYSANIFVCEAPKIIFTYSSLYSYIWTRIIY